MDTRVEIREFLTTRRAKITPEQAGLHLFNLARAARPRQQSKPRRVQPVVRDSVHRVLDSMSGAPAFVRNGRHVVERRTRR